MRTESIPNECYKDRNLLIQTLAKTLVQNGTLVYRASDKTTPGYAYIYFEVNGQQLSWHVPENEILLELPVNEELLTPIDVTERRDRLVHYLTGNFS